MPVMQTRTPIALIAKHWYERVVGIFVWNVLVGVRLLCAVLAGCVDRRPLQTPSLENAPKMPCLGTPRSFQGK